MNIYNNFLPKNKFNIIKKEIMSSYFSWFFNDGIINVPDNYFQFTYCFYEQSNNFVDSKILLLSPILKKLKHKKLRRVKANLTTRDFKHTEHGMHIDFPKLPKAKTGIYYINTSNGYTKFANGKIVKCEENKYIEFDSYLKHTGVSCTDEKRKIVINFNYE